MMGSVAIEHSLFIAACNNGMRVYDARTGDELEQSPFTSSVSSNCLMVCVSPDGSKILAFYGVSQYDTRIVVYNVLNGVVSQQVEIETPRSGSVLNMGFSQDGTRFFICVTTSVSSGSYYMLVFESTGELLLDLNGSSYRKRSTVGAFTLDSRFFVYEASNLSGSVNIVDLNGEFSTGSLYSLPSASGNPLLHSVLTHPITGDIICLIGRDSDGSVNPPAILYRKPC
jgi:WD40 repeat protein